MRAIRLLALVSLLVSGCGELAILERTSPLPSVSVPSSTPGSVLADRAEASAASTTTEASTNGAESGYCDEVDALSHLWVQALRDEGFTGDNGQLEHDRLLALEDEYGEQLHRVVGSSPAEHRQAWQMLLNLHDGIEIIDEDSYQNLLTLMNLMEVQCYAVGFLQFQANGLIYDYEYLLETMPEFLIEEPVSFPQDYCESVADFARVLPDGMGDDLSNERVEPSAEVMNVYTEKLDRVASFAPTDHAEFWALLGTNFSYESFDLVEEKLGLIGAGCQGVASLVMSPPFVYDLLAESDQFGLVAEAS